MRKFRAIQLCGHFTVEEIEVAPSPITGQGSIRIQTLTASAQSILPSLLYSSSVSCLFSLIAFRYNIPSTRNALTLNIELNKISRV